MSTQGPQFPLFLQRGGLTKVELPIPLQTSEKEKKYLGTLLARAFLTFIMVMAIPAMFGVDITAPGGGDPVPTELHKD